MADNFELREEINRGGEEYFLQTTFLPRDRSVITVFFKKGISFDSDTYQLKEEKSMDEAIELAKVIHNRNRDKFLLLLDVKEKISSSDKSSFHLKIANALFLRNLYHEAVDEAETAIKKGEKGAEPYKIVSESWYKIGEYSKAFKAVNEGLKIRIDYPDLHNLAGKIYYRRNECRRAVDSFKRAIELNYYYGAPYLNIVRTYIMNSIIKQDYELSHELEGDFDEYLDKVATLNPSLNGDKTDEVKELFSKGKYDEVLKLLDSVEEASDRIYIDKVISELYLIILQSDNNLDPVEIDKYLDAMKKIVDQNPNFADAYNSLGILYTAKCKMFMDKAGKAFEKAVMINKDYEKAKKNIRLTENERHGVFILLKALLD
ncbi:hypothetical protein J7M07_06255 [bacterium]|nr:hypothetical protein [bacterium]